MLETRLTASDLSPFSFGASAGPSACVVLVVSRAISDRALVEHGVGHLHETGDVGPRYVVTWPIVLLGRLADRVVDPPHDRLQTSVDLLFGPLDELHALSHLQPGHRHPAGVRRLARCVENAGGGEAIDAPGDRRHVGPFCHEHHPAFHQVVGVLRTDLVLRGAGERALRGHAPEGVLVASLSGVVDRMLELLRVLADPTPAFVLEALDPFELLAVDAVWIVDEPVGVGEGDGVGTEVEELLHGELGDVPAARDEACLASEDVVPGGQHLPCEVHDPVSGGLLANLRAAPLDPLAGDGAHEPLGDALVLAEEVADLTLTHADVPGGHTDVPAGDIGVGEREIGYLFGQYKRIAKRFVGAITGKGIKWGGSQIRQEATGYGVVYFAREMLATRDDVLGGKTCLVSGSGNVAQFTVEKLLDLGAHVVTLSDSDGFIHDPDSIDREKLEWVKRLKNERRGRIREYAEEFDHATYHPATGGDENPLWCVPAQCAFPSATQDEISAKDADNLVKGGVTLVAEGANMPTVSEGVDRLTAAGVLYAPSKAANAGGGETIDALGDRRHVGPFCHEHHPAFHQVVGVLRTDLVLRGAGERALRGHAPE